MTATDAHPRSGARSLFVLVAMSAAVAIVIFNSSAVNVALPSMSADLELTASSMRLVVVIYSAAFAAMLLPAGHLCGRVGAHSVLLAGLAATAVGGLGAALLEPVPAIMIARALMGVGAACVMPSTLALVVASAAEEGRSRAIAVWSAVSVAGAAGGPILGGFLVDEWGWNYIFGVSAVGAVLMAVVVALFVARDRTRTRSRADLRFLALASTTITMFVLGLTIIGDETATGGVLITISAVLAMAALAARRRRQTSNPTGDVVQRREFFGASVSNMLLFFALAGTLFVLTQKLQFQFGLSPITAGLAVAPVTAALVVGVGSSTAIAARFGRRRVVVAGLAVAATGSIALALFPSDLTMVLGSVFVAGLGVGLALPLVTESMVAAVPSDRVGEAAAVNDTMQEIGYALGVAILGSVSSLVYTLSLTGAPTSGASLGATLSSADAAGDSALRESAISAFTYGATVAFAVGAVFLISGALVAHLYLPSTDHRAHNGEK